MEKLKPGISHNKQNSGRWTRTVLTVISSMLLSLSALGQTGGPVPPETPVSVLQKFKAGLDKADYAAMCRLMAEEDGTGPLKPVLYEQMQRSLEGLVKLWRGIPFQYGTAEIQELNENGSRTVGTVQVNVLNLRQEVRFVLLKFGQSWYVFDLEIYFE
jgi:hypothetical protein